MGCWMKTSPLELSGKFYEIQRTSHVTCEVCSSVVTLVFNIWGSCLLLFYRVSPCLSRLRPWLCKSLHSCGCAPSCCSATKCPSAWADGHAWSVMEAARLIKSVNTLRLCTTAGCQRGAVRHRKDSKGTDTHSWIHLIYPNAGGRCYFWQHSCAEPPNHLPQMFFTQGISNIAMAWQWEKCPGGIWFQGWLLASKSDKHSQSAPYNSTIWFIPWILTWPPSSPNLHFGLPGVFMGEFKEHKEQNCPERTLHTVLWQDDKMLFNLYVLQVYIHICIYLYTIILYLSIIPIF